jgi:NADPH:quinone reductase-like Zn-dependent oxidoreductase
MERLEYNSYGGPDVVHLSAYTPPRPGRHDVVVRVAASSINPLDWKIRSGDFKMVTGWRFPRAMGSDFAGTVDSVGSAVSHFQPGDAVLGTTSIKGAGAFAPVVVTAERLLVAKPDCLSFVEAASLPTAGVTAWLALVKTAHLLRAERVFVNGAMGSVGSAAVEIAQAIGAEVAGRVAPASVVCAEALGIRPAWDYTKPLSTSLDGYFDLVLDCNGSLSAAESRRLIRRGGLVIDILPTAGKLLRSLTTSWYQVLIANPKAEYLQQVVKLAVARKLVIPIARTVSLADAPDLLASLERGLRLHGKAVIAF